MHSDMQLKFLNFEPEFEIRNLVVGVAERLHLSAPSDSVMRLAFKKGKGIVQASCQIASQGGVFVAEAVSHSPIRAVQKIEKKIRWQLEDWKRRRFVNEDQTTTNLNDY